MRRQGRGRSDLLLPKGAQWVAGGFSRRTRAPGVKKSRRDGRHVGGVSPMGFYRPFGTGPCACPHFDLLLPKGAQWVAGGFSRRTRAPGVKKSRRDGRHVRGGVSHGFLPSLRDWVVCMPALRSLAPEGSTVGSRRLQPPVSGARSREVPKGRQTRARGCLPWVSAVPSGLDGARARTRRLKPPAIHFRPFGTGVLSPYL